MTNDETLQTQLRENGLKATTARMTLLQTMQQANGPLCYEDLRDTLAMDKATFYRNMQQFEQHHLVNAFEANDRRRYYELTEATHAHFICTDCNRIECLHGVTQPELPGRRVERIVIQGQCPACTRGDA